MSLRRHSISPLSVEPETPKFTNPDWSISSNPNAFTTSLKYSGISTHPTHASTDSSLTAEQLADAAATSSFATKVKNIDKASKDLDRRRKSSASTQSGDGTGMEPRRDSTRGSIDLQPLSMAQDTAALLPGSSRDASVSGNEEDVPNTASESSFHSSFTFQSHHKDAVIISPKAIEKPVNGVRQRLSANPHALSDLSYSQERGSTAPGSSPFSAAEQTRLQGMIVALAEYLAKFDFPITQRAWRVFEWCDIYWTFDVIRYTCQDILTKEWTRQVPFVQPASPAFTSALRLAHVLHEISDLDENRDLEVFEFCAGSGGPTPTFEQLINQHRRSIGEQPIHFKISDLYPNLEAWQKLEGSSPWLSTLR